ncbi:MAG: DNA polymerase III subunit gamma/tau [Armatimonadia bacterium]|nr:DNA polymerase III subunit gamma/tau [Armatimonadia bacterium]
MAYQTFALKYRPQTFDEIIGQDHVATTLKNAVSEGRVAHGYLFAGPRGTGKTSTARVLAKAMSCENGPTPEPCCECPMCQAVASGGAMDLIEIDAASNRGIDDIRELRERVGYAPTQARCKFYILDEAHMLTPAAANALLKTLEEPPDFVHFVLATTELHNILPTIRSRCQTFEFRPIPQIEIVKALQRIAQSEGVATEEAALGAIARAAGGAMRDAESIFDQVIAYGRGDVTLQVVNSILGVTDADLLTAIADAVADSDIESVFSLVDEIVTSGKDIGQLLEDLSLHYRDLLRLSLGATPPAWMRAAADGEERMQSQARAMGPRRIGEIIEELGEASARIRDTAQKPLLLEVTLAHMASIPTEGAIAPPAPEPAQTDTETPSDEEAAEDEPEPEPEPAAEAAESSPAEPETRPEPAVQLDEPLTIEIVTEHWPKVVDVLGAEHPAIAAIVRGARPHSVDGDTITLRFSRAFERDRAKDSYADQIAAAAAELFGRPLLIACALQEANAGTGNSSDETAGEPATSDGETSAEEQQEKVLRLLDEFDGTEQTPG